jgi:hypothetical protein
MFPSNPSLSCEAVRVVSNCLVLDRQHHHQPGSLLNYRPNKSDSLRTGAEIYVFNKPPDNFDWLCFLSPNVWALCLSHLPAISPDGSPFPVPHPCSSSVPIIGHPLLDQAWRIRPVGKAAKAQLAQLRTSQSRILAPRDSNYNSKVKVFKAV